MQAYHSELFLRPSFGNFVDKTSPDLQYLLKTWRQIAKNIHKNCQGYKLQKMLKIHNDFGLNFATFPI